MDERSLGCEISCRYCCEDFAAVLNDEGDNNRLDKDAIIQTKCLGVQVEVCRLCWEKRDLVVWPNNRAERRAGYTIFSITKIVERWRVGVELTASGFGRATDKSWRATP